MNIGLVTIMDDHRERDLEGSLTFGLDDYLGLASSEAPLPRPVAGDTLLRGVLGSEEQVFPYSDWITDDLDFLRAFAYQYRECAIELIKMALRGKVRRDNIVYVVAFLYRHSIELNLKAIIVRGCRFHSSDAPTQKTLINGHSVEALWREAKGVIADYMDADDIKVVEGQLMELHTLDARADGFRYPFAFAKSDGSRQPLASRLANASFDNLVWVLDGLCAWLEATADYEQDYFRTVGDIPD